MKHTDKWGAPLGVLVLSALLLAGCGNGGGADGDGTTAPAEPSATAEDTAGPTAEDTAGPTAEDTAGPTAAGTATPSDTASPSGSPGADATGGSGGEAAAVVPAIGAAEEAVGGGQAFGIEREDGPASWAVTVADGDREHEVYVSREGDEVIGQEEDDALDADDRERLDRVEVPLEDGVRTALETANGTLDEAQLETEDGTTVWEVEIDEQDGNSVDVYVDVADGSVLTIDR